MRLATYNVENMFERSNAMNLPNRVEGKPILDDYQRLNELIQELIYTDEIKSELLTIMKKEKYKGLITQNKREFILLRDLRGDFISNPKNKPAEIKANGRGTGSAGLNLRRVLSRRLLQRIWLV